MSEQKEKAVIRYVESTELATELSKTRESDIPSMYLPGTVAGSRSQAESEDGNFRVVSSLGGANEGVVFSDEDIRKFQDASEKMYKADTLYGGIIDGFAQFIIGKGVSIEADDESEKAKKFIKDFCEVNKFDGLDREIVFNTLIDGEVFIRIFSKGVNGNDAKIPVIRILRYWEISKIERDPKDRKTVISYTRSYLDGTTVKNETIPAKDIVHVRVDCLAEERGLPPFARIMQRCAEYADLVHTRLVLNRLKASFYLEEIVDGSPSSTTSQDGMASNTVKTSKSGKNMKRMPKPGSKLVHNKAVEYRWLSPQVNGADAEPDARMFRLSIAAGAQCPEFLMGDASNANYSSTLVAQNPFVRKCEGMQDAFTNAFKELFSRVISHGVGVKEVPEQSQETKITQEASRIGFWRKLRAIALKEQMDYLGNLVEKTPIKTKTTVTCNWPNLITQDVLQDTQAAQLHQAMGLVSKRTLRPRFGYDNDVEEKQLAEEREAEGAEQEAEPENPGFTDKQRKEELDREKEEEDEDAKSKTK